MPKSHSKVRSKSTLGSRAQKAASKIVKTTGRKKNASEKTTQKAIVRTGKQIKASKKDAANAARTIKRTGKAIQKETKQIKSTAKAVGKLVRVIKNLKKKPPKKKSLTLAEIERLLGEDFTSLAQAKRALKRESKPATKKQVQRFREQQRRDAAQRAVPAKKKPVSSPLSRKRVYEMRDLPEALEQATFNATLEELNDHADDYNALLKPGEMFGGRIGVGKRSGYTYQIFPTFEKFLRYLSDYTFAQKYGDIGDAKDDLIGMVKIIRYKAPGKGVSATETYNAWRERKTNEVFRHAEAKRQRKLKRTAEKREVQQARRERRKMEEREREAGFTLRRLIAENKQAEEMRRLAEAQLKDAQRRIKKLEGRK